MQLARETCGDVTGRQRVDGGPGHGDYETDYQYNESLSFYSFGRVATGVTTDDLCDRVAGFLPSNAFKASCKCTRISGKFFLRLSQNNAVPELTVQPFRFLIIRNNFRWTVGDASVALGGYDKSGTGVPATGTMLFSSFVNNSRQPQWEVLYDKTIMLPPVGELGTDTGLSNPPAFTFNIDKMEFEFDLDVDFPVWYKYDSANQRWLTIVGGCGIFFYAATSALNILTPAWYIYGSLRMRWEDIDEKRV